MTRAEAFRQLGTRPNNVYRSLSARSHDGHHVVAITLWQEQLRGPAGAMVYELSNYGDWHRGNCLEFFRNLEYAVAHCGGEIFIVLVVRDRPASPKVRTIDCYPVKNWAMRITHLDSATGSFRLEQCALPFANRPLAA